MTAKDVYDKISTLKTVNPETNEPVYLEILPLYYSGKEEEAIAYIKDFFECNDFVAENAFKLFKMYVGPPPLPSQVARANAEALASQNKPRCPYCRSTDLHRITSFEKAANIALFGVFGNKRKYQWHCNSCNTDF